MTFQTYLVLTVACACIAVAVCVFCTCICFLYLVLSIHTPVNKLIWGMRWDCASYCFNLEKGNDKVKIISAKFNDCIKKSKTAVPSLWCAVNCCVWKNHHRLYMRWLPLRLRLSCHDINKKLKVTGTHQISIYVLFASTPTIFISPATFGRREKNEPVQPIILEEWLKFERKKKNKRGRENRDVALQRDCPEVRSQEAFCCLFKCYHMRVS